ncbi:MAG: hypothetical protein H7A46_12315 [Verrucomicrobiales bacterium]|nr:hypothetical protein [Verrucomicrobiales bacterium]
MNAPDEALNMGDKAQALIESIERAFADVTLEDGVSLREADVIDDYGTREQRQAARAQDEHRDWRNIPEAAIARYYWCLSFFDAKGMRFHLPAYMCFALRRYSDSASASIDSTIYALGTRDDDLNRLLTTEQRSVVRQFLEFMASDTDGRVDGVQARHALENGWK